MTIENFIEQVNTWGHKKVPFLFYVDFELEKPVALVLDDVRPSDIKFNFNGFTNCKTISVKTEISSLVYTPISKQYYEQAFNLVKYHLAYGDSFLTNLTIKTPVTIAGSLEELFNSSDARYKLFVKDHFLVFSPEIFVQIKDDQIFSYPMKGTIDASTPDAAQTIMDNEKEKSEHITIVDLIRNDLSMVADNVRVNRFRYIERIKTNRKHLLQVSSEIKGKLPKMWRSNLGNLLVTLLPAGSVSGAPKAKTLSIIQKAEAEKRGYYSGVCGYYDGDKLDSGVMIRFIEQQNHGLFYRSGGGITTQSDLDSEYQELLDKIYVPLH